MTDKGRLDFIHAFQANAGQTPQHAPGLLGQEINGKDSVLLEFSTGSQGEVESFNGTAGGEDRIPSSVRRLSNSCPVSGSSSRAIPTASIILCVRRDSRFRSFSIIFLQGCPEPHLTIRCAIGADPLSPVHQPLFFLHTVDEKSDAMRKPLLLLVDPWLSH